jgi:8-oxo-dGTP pyrophosphatase MutT (NUDIX family)
VKTRVHRRVASTRLCSYAAIVHRRGLLDLLAAHRPADAGESGALRATVEFVRANPSCFERTLQVGHVTGSAWVVSGDGSAVVLLHHGKLRRWLQPGGHADGDSDVARVALREAREETSLGSLRFGGRGIFDVDVHEIPERGPEPAHLHYDVRFLFFADRAEDPLPSDESRDALWLGLEDARRMAPEESILRMIRKTRGELE